MAKNCFKLRVECKYVLCAFKRTLSLYLPLWRKLENYFPFVLLYPVAVEKVEGNFVPVSNVSDK